MTGTSAASGPQASCVCDGVDSAPAADERIPKEVRA